MTTAPIDGSSNIRRKSVNNGGDCPCTASTSRPACGSRPSSTSHSAATSTSGKAARAVARALPWLRIPTTPTASRSLEAAFATAATPARPATPAAIPAAFAALAPRNSRRLMGASWDERDIRVETGTAGRNSLPNYDGIAPGNQEKTARYGSGDASNALFWWEPRARLPGTADLMRIAVRDGHRESGRKSGGPSSAHGERG